MVRSPKSLINENKIGYGWKHINFSAHNEDKGVIKEIIEKNGTIGRMKNQVKSFFNLKENDIVIVPVGKSIVIGVVDGQKKYDPEFKGGYGANQININFFKKDGKIVKVPRVTLKQNLESRLRLRTTIGDLTKFGHEIEYLIDNITNLGIFKVEDSFLQEKENYEQKFKIELLKALQTGHTRLKAGGRGLEELIKELLKIQGYSQVDILDKKNGEGIADIDIQATSESNPFLKAVLIQVKHHNGLTSSHAVKQLIAYEQEIGIDFYKWVITTGNISENTKLLAEKNLINIMEGHELVDWIYANLGILNVPQLSWIP